MKRIIKTMLVVLAAVIGAGSVQTVRADDFTVAGVVTEVDRSLSTIVIAPDDVMIMGFPFHNLEVQLDEVLDPLNPAEDGITIDAGDCVTVEYAEKELASGDVVNKWESLTEYCEECTETEPCFVDEGGLARQPGRNRPEPPPFTGHGRHPGKSSGHRP